MTINGRQIRENLQARDLCFLGRSTAAAGGTDRLTDAGFFLATTLPAAEEADAWIRITTQASGTATASAATTLTDGTAPFVNLGLIGCLVAAYTTAGALTIGTITTNSTSVLTVAGGWSNGTPSSTSAYVIHYQHVAKVKRIDVTTGDIYFTPPVTTAVQTGARYELWRNGQRPDQVDRARDDALTGRVSVWLNHALSQLSDCSFWLANATETVTAPSMAFPNEFEPYSLLVNNNGVATGHANSESFYVSDAQQYVTWCRVSSRSGTARFRVRDITHGADISLSPVGNGPTFTRRGWTWGVFTFSVPTDCEEIQVWPGNDGANDVSEWASIGLLNRDWNEFSLPILSTASRSPVSSEHDVGVIWAYDVAAATPQGPIRRQAIDDVNRERSGAGVRLTFAQPPGQRGGPVYYQARHRYPALQSDYLTKTQRVQGDETLTDCPDDYIDAATTVVLYEGPSAASSPDAKAVLTLALKDLGAAERQWGPDPVHVPERRNQGGIRVMRL